MPIDNELRDNNVLGGVKTSACGHAPEVNLESRRVEGALSDVTNSGNTNAHNDLPPGAVN